MPSAAERAVEARTTPMPPHICRLGAARRAQPIAAKCIASHPRRVQSPLQAGCERSMTGTTADFVVTLPAAA
jgi:hypothetical protein